LADVGSDGQYGNLSLWDQANVGDGWSGKTKSGAGNFVVMDGAFQTGPLSQTVTGLTIGKTYDLTFNYASGQQSGFSGDTQQQLGVTLGSDISQVLTAAHREPVLTTRSRACNSRETAIT
jgi:hypothetical protein